jgi:hypothetical protein
MKFPRRIDTSTNVFSPILTEYFFYRAGQHDLVSLNVKNYFSDGLWAYAFGSAS